VSWCPETHCSRQPDFTRKQSRVRLPRTQNANSKRARPVTRGYIAGTIERLNVKRFCSRRRSGQTKDGRQSTVSFPYCDVFCKMSRGGVTTDVVRNKQSNRCRRGFFRLATSAPTATWAIDSSPRGKKVQVIKERTRKEDDGRSSGQGSGRRRWLAWESASTWPRKVQVSCNDGSRV
jgi:hypothetical protein